MDGPVQLELFSAREIRTEVVKGPKSKGQWTDTWKKATITHMSDGSQRMRIEWAEEFRQPIWPLLPILDHGAQK